jgi:hypothetical protein
MNGKPWFETKVIEDNTDYSHTKQDNTGVKTIQIKGGEDAIGYIPTKNKKQKML